MCQGTVKALLPEEEKTPWIYRKAEPHRARTIISLLTINKQNSDMRKDLLEDVSSYMYSDCWGPDSLGLNSTF